MLINSIANSYTTYVSTYCSKTTIVVFYYLLFFFHNSSSPSSHKAAIMLLFATKLMGAIAMLDLIVASNVTDLVHSSYSRSRAITIIYIHSLRPNNVIGSPPAISSESKHQPATSYLLPTNITLTSSITVPADSTITKSACSLWQKLTIYIYRYITITLTLSYTIAPSSISTIETPSMIYVHSKDKSAVTNSPEEPHAVLETKAESSRSLILSR